MEDRLDQRLRPLNTYLVFILVFCGVILIKPVKAAEVDTVTAMTVARNFYLSRLNNSALKISLPPGKDIEFSLAHVELRHISKKAAGKQTDQQVPLYYVFESGESRGFIIVSADDRVTPVLGYTFTGGYSDIDQPPAFINWMNQCKEQIGAVIINDLATDPGIKEEWITLYDEPATKSTKAINEVLPLLTTRWDQNCYYNDHSPLDASGPCGRAWAGCVAVAMSQIMKFWNHPATGYQIPGYATGSDYGCLPDIVSTSYDWVNMPDALTSSSTSNEVDAVAELLYHTGVAVYMDYGADGSGAFSDDARNALVSYFNYSSSAQHLSRYSMSEESWVQLIMDELDNGRPVYYGGSGSIGHAFVCDGYQDPAFFHFNWGWSGAYNGYFYLNDLTPGGENFNSFQDAIIGITPEMGSQPDPLDNIITIEGTGAGYTQAFTSGGSGAWDHDVCSVPTPGDEQVYRFVPSITGYYDINVVSASGNLVYGWRKASCAESGWECIRNISSAGTYGDMPWTEGVAYYLLLDDVDLVGNSHTFYINDPVPALPVVEYHWHMIDDDSQDASSGDGDGLAENGETIELEIILRNSGDFDTHNVSAVLSTSDPDISVITGSSDFGDISSGITAQSVTAYVFDISEESPEKDVIFNLEISSDETSWSEQFTVHIVVDIPPSPVLEYYSHLIDDNTTSGDGDGKVEQGETVNMQLTLRNTGDLNAQNVSAVLSVSDPDISLSEANGSFGNIAINSNGVSAEDYVFSVSNTSPEKDVTFNLDISSDEGDWTDQFVIHVNLYSPPAPELEYFSHQIDDNTSSGDGDGLVEAGETINIPITLRNAGDAAAHNVSAVLSAPDVDISIVEGSNNFQDIAAGGNAQSSGNYVFEVAADCREKDVAFTLEITSDEDSWTAQFLLHVYEGPNSISDDPFSSGIAVYPNPARDALFLKSAMEIDSQFEVRIMDSRGATVFVHDLPSFIKGEIIEIDLSDFDPGIYFIQLIHSNLSESRKIIIE